MIIDFHTHVGIDVGDKKLQRLDFKDLKNSMDKWGIDKSVVFPMNEEGSLVEKSLEILDKSKKEKWIIPFLRIDPKSIDKEEFEKLTDKGFKGLKLHSRSQDFEIDSEDFFWIYEICEEKKLPILFHCSVKEDQSHPARVFNVARKFPNLIVVMAHFFGGDSRLVQEAKKYPNLYVDTSINLGTMPRTMAVKRHGYKNLLFASDIPFDSQGVALLKVKDAGLSKKDEELIFHKNAEKILNL